MGNKILRIFMDVESKQVKSGKITVQLIRSKP